MGKGKSTKRRTFLLHLTWIIPLLVADFFLVRWWSGQMTQRREDEAAAQVAAAAALEEQTLATDDPQFIPSPPPVWQEMLPPTPQQNLLNTDEPGVLQPTGSGRLESAKFGSTRIGQRNNKLYPVFHEGVDIAPLSRDRKGAATDSIFATANGRVAFINSVAGNSSYGKYIVLEHQDSSLGMVKQRDGSEVPATVYTLYAHLADIRFGLRVGQDIQAGDTLGVMGATSNTSPPIPLSRSHLHWEIGLMLNNRFARHSREQKMIPDFGNYNGQNLFGLDPLDFYKMHAEDPELTMAAYLEQLEPACEVILRGKWPNFFNLYPALWEGDEYNEGPIYLALSESGLPIRGRNADEEEIAVLKNARHAVLNVDTNVLGRNGRAYVTKTGNAWQFTTKGKQWAELLFY